MWTWIRPRRALTITPGRLPTVAAAAAAEVAPQAVEGVAGATKKILVGEARGDLVVVVVVVVEVVVQIAVPKTMAMISSAPAAAAAAAGAGPWSHRPPNSSP